MKVTNNFVGQGALLFIDQILIAGTNWIFWLIISKLTDASEIGQATVIYSFALLFATLAQLGLEYPLLKKSMSQGSSILVYALAIETMITLILVPILYFIVSSSINQSIASAYTWIGLSLFVLTSIGFVAKFSLLGISDARNVLIWDIMGTASKFVLGIGLVYMGWGAFGILVSFVIYSLVITAATLALSLKKIGRREQKYIEWHWDELLQVIREALMNTPAKFSRLVILSLSIVMLGFFGISDAEIGIFYMTMMISIVIASLASSISYTVIPASSQAKTDLTEGSLRIGLSFTSPLITALAVAPAYILSLLGQEYTLGGASLFMLSIGILPSIIVMNSVSKFNNSNESQKIIVMGSVQVAAFLILFVVLVPAYGIFGAAVSIFIAYLASALPPLIWFNRQIRSFVLKSTMATFSGILLGYGVLFWTNSATIIIHPIIAIFASVSLTIIITLLLKNTTPTEIKNIIKSIK
jgi:O-antigen/teichoic acid export membrane protein